MSMKAVEEEVSGLSRRLETLRSVDAEAYVQNLPGPHIPMRQLDKYPGRWFSNVVLVLNSDAEWEILPRKYSQEDLLSKHPCC